MIPRLSPLSPSIQPLLLALGFALLVLIGGTSVWLVRQTDTDAARAVQTLEVKERLTRLQALIWRAESNQRSFLLVGDERYREAFRSDADAVAATMGQLENAFAGAGRALFRQLRQAITDEFSMLEQTGEWREREGLDTAPPNFLEGSRAEEIRAMIGQLIQQEQRLLAEELAASSRTAKLLLAASLSGVVLILLLAAISIFIVRRSTGRMIAAQKALKEANESLEETVARRTAELRQANQEIQNFAYVVSHDLRAPLVNIMGFTSEIEIIRKELRDRRSADEAKAEDAEGEEALDRDFDEALHFIKSSIARMDRLIKAILKLTREGRRDFRLELIDMTELVRSIAEGLGYQAQMKGVAITVDPLPSFHGDRLALEQVFSNLLDNALKYLRDDMPGQIRVTGRATNGEIVYEVQDNGRGIEEKDLERIFDIFRRSGPQDRPGEGIGLTHVRTLVRRLGGSIAVRSEPGRGSTFQVTFPSRPPASTSETDPWQNTSPSS
ncbi:sensor histidine kinase [Chelativorans salis]|uniref:histidine kinase n=1 Tax=Chelativorans salis TaxID=2978478 RepID=A0ABT2LTN3_9HYPH|nr:ATP-binding protein [Chelativorans sp. EGI FJ00035]MCT7377859.1 ATP-binding protein [Chelativorans sp. EGI FJ00035]